MNNRNPADLSNEELIRDEKNIKTLTLIFMGVLLVLFASTIFLTFKSGFSAMSVIPIALLHILSMNINNWNALKKEIKSRNL